MASPPPALPPTVRVHYDSDGDVPRCNPDDLRAAIHHEAGAMLRKELAKLADHLQTEDSASTGSQFAGVSSCVGADIEGWLAQERAPSAADSPSVDSSFDLDNPNWDPIRWLRDYAALHLATDGARRKLNKAADAFEQARTAEPATPAQAGDTMAHELRMDAGQLERDRAYPAIALRMRRAADALERRAIPSGYTEGWSAAMLAVRPICLRHAGFAPASEKWKVVEAIDKDLRALTPPAERAEDALPDQLLVGLCYAASMLASGWSGEVEAHKSAHGKITAEIDKIRGEIAARSAKGERT